MEKDEDKLLEKIKFAFHINNLVDTDMHRHGTCNYNYDNQNEVTEVSFKNFIIRKLYDSITSLTKLTKLTITRSYADEIDYFDRYGTDFYETVLHSLPEAFGMLQTLKKVDFTGNGLESLPESIGNLSNLQELILKYNNLKRLPDSISNLRKLKYLDLSQNNLDIDVVTKQLQDIIKRGCKVKGLGKREQGMDKIL